MTPFLTTLVSAVLAFAGVPPASAAVPVQRYLLVIGANAGSPDRPKLQYAISDAEHFARVMVELGGVPIANEVILRQPKLNELINALDQLTARVKDAKRVKDAGRIEVILYYSGHADEQG
ncbi:MAG TPA: caspase family protein, partial [Vicinamibacterales bacterium]